MLKDTSLYSGRFYIIEVISYFLVFVPWAVGYLGAGEHGAVAVRILLSTAVAVFIVVLRDVRKKIHSLDTLKQSLAMATVHDLKGPLSSIIGVLAIISEPDMEPQMKEQLLKVAVASSRSMEKLVQVLVDTDRMEIAKITLQKQNIVLEDFLPQTLSGFAFLGTDRGIALTLCVAGHMPPIYADRDLLQRVFENLLLNAFKYSDRGATIAVKAEYGGNKFRFEVRDTGIGISREDLTKVFDKYYRVEGGKEGGSRKGSGLGLYFCRLAIEAHGGSIAIDSRPGQGTSVLFEIPVLLSGGAQIAALLRRTLSGAGKTKETSI
jgi:two-component system sensor histidine kinase VicK